MTDDEFAQAAGGGRTEKPQSDDEFVQSVGGIKHSFVGDQWDSFKDAARGLAGSIVGGVGNAVSGAIDAVDHPIDTAKNIGNAISNTSAQDLNLGLNRAFRNIPVAGPALNALITTPEQRQDQAQSDVAHAQEHPVTDFIQKSLPMFALPEGLPAQVATLATDTFAKAMAAGKSYTDAVHDALNTAALSGGMLAAFKAPGFLGKKAAQELGVSEEAIARRIENPKAIDAAEQYVGDPEALKNRIDQEVAPINQAVDTAQEGVENAKQDIASTKLPPQDLASEIPEHLDTQGSKLKELSSQAFDILNDEGHTFPVGNLTNAVQQRMDDLKINDVIPSIGPDAAAYHALDNFKSMVDQIGQQSGGDIPAPAVKQLIQQLDGLAKDSYSTNAGALSPVAAGNLAMVRRSFDSVLKDASPAYAEKMGELAPQVQLVNDMSKMFGNEQTAMGTLKAAADPMTPRGLIARQKLEAYDAQNGTDFLQRVTDFYDKPKQNLAAAQQALQEAQGTAANVNLLGPNSTEGVVKALKGGRNIEARKQLEALNPEIAQIAQDTQYANEFSRPTINGSRRVNTGGYLGGTVGLAIGGLIGHGAGMVLGDAAIGHEIGAGLGALGGFLADRYGGEAVKTVVDAGIKINKLMDTPYLGVIMKAAQKSPKALAITHYMLSQTDPGYQKATNSTK